MTDVVSPPTGVAVLGGRFRLGAVLGRGGMADVYRADDALTPGEQAAVKVFRAGSPAPLDGDDEAGIARFRAEVRLLGRLHHPHLVPLLASGEDDGRPWCAMPLLDGGPVGALRGQLPPCRVAALGSEVAAALAHVHDNAVIHRDVSPGNVLLDGQGRAYLADFGVARLADTIGLTRTGVLLGTAAYLSPEQVRGERVTSAVDVYSLALVLLETLTARREYPGTPAESAVARLWRAPLAPVALGRGWAAVIRAMTSPLPGDRPTAAQAAAELAALA